MAEANPLSRETERTQTMTNGQSNVRRLLLKGSKHRTLGDYAYEQILRLIIRGEFPESRKLPSETALAEAIGVSRPVVRQALAMLRGDGVVASRQGSGSYVIRRPHHSVLAVSSDGSLADLLRCYEFRIALESAAAGLAAQRRTDEHLAAMAEALEDMTNSFNADAFDTATDHRFHIAVCRATCNKYFESSLAAIHDHMIGTMDLCLRLLHVHRPVGWQERLISDHREIAAAIADRDSTRAAEMARRHVEYARDTVLADADTDSAEIINQLHIADDN